MLRVSATLLIVAAVAIGFGPAGAADERFALVIGNSKYQAVTPLPNPSRDAQAFSAFLKAAGFEVKTAIDLDQAGMRRAVGDFADSLVGKPADSVALIFYAGHGVQVDGQNYLLPVDARIKREADVALQAIRFSDIMNSLERVRGKTRLVFLDACRNNPFADGTTPHGLAMVDAPAGTLVAYSTSPGSEAEDGSGANSPFTTALISAGRRPGLPIETTLKDVRLAVHRETTGRQVPWEVSSLIQPFSFFSTSTAVATAPQLKALAAAPGDDKPPVVPSEDKSVLAPGQSKSAAIADVVKPVGASGLDRPVVAAGQDKLAAATPQDMPVMAPRLEKSVDEWRKELRSKTAEEALEIAIREDNVIVYEVVLELFPRAPFVVYLRTLVDRRIEIWDWFDTVTFDLVEGYEAFLNLYPNSDLAATARRLLQRARLRSLTTSTSPGALGLASAIGPAAKTQIQTVVKEVPVVKEVVRTVVREVPVIKEVVKTVKVPEVKTVTKVVQSPCRCSTPERGSNVPVTPNVGIGIGIGRGGFGGSRGGYGGGGNSGGGVNRGSGHYR